MHALREPGTNHYSCLPWCRQASKIIRYSNLNLYNLNLASWMAGFSPHGNKEWYCRFRNEMVAYKIVRNDLLDYKQKDSYVALTLLIPKYLVNFRCSKIVCFRELSNLKDINDPLQFQFVWHMSWFVPKVVRHGKLRNLFVLHGFFLS